jgi:hypothetical protein
MSEKKEEGTVINLQSRVAVVATEKHPFADKGEKFDIHPSVAEGFLKSGYIEKYKGAEAE